MCQAFEGGINTPAVSIAQVQHLFIKRGIKNNRDAGSISQHATAQT